MSSLAAIKRIRKLHRKKGRRESGLAIAQGSTVISELIESDLDVVEIHVREDLEHPEVHDVELFEATQKELDEMGTMENGVNAVAVFRIPEDIDFRPHGYSMACDGLTDPGNLGTIIRSSENFGVNTVLIGRDCVDPWNPKCVQASMGSIFRMPLVHMNLEELSTNEISVFSADMEGSNLYDLEIANPSVFVLGNETHGVGVRIQGAKSITIPTTGKAESLNVAMAATVIAAELYRRSLSS